MTPSTQRLGDLGKFMEFLPFSFQQLFLKILVPVGVEGCFGEHTLFVHLSSFVAETFQLSWILNH